MLPVCSIIRTRSQLNKFFRVVNAMPNSRERLQEKNRESVTREEKRLGYKRKEENRSQEKRRESVTRENNRCVFKRHTQRENTTVNTHEIGRQNHMDKLESVD